MEPTENRRSVAGVVRYDERAVRRLRAGYQRIAGLGGVVALASVGGAVATGNGGLWFAAALFAFMAALYAFLAGNAGSEFTAEDGLAFELTASGIRVPHAGLLSWDEIEVVELKEVELSSDWLAQAQGPQAALGASGGMARGLAGAVGAPTSRSSIGLRVKQPAELEERLEGPGAGVVGGRTLTGQPQGMIHGEPLEIPFNEAVEVIAVAAQHHGVPVVVR